MSRRALSFALLTFAPAIFASVVSPASAQAPPFLCGPDCTTPGRYVLCIDSFDSVPATGGSLGIEDFLEAACATYPAPAPSFTLSGFVGLFGPGEMMAAAIEVYQEVGTDMPGMLLYDTGAAIPFSNFIGFSGLFFADTALGSEFRLCVRQQFDDPVLTMGVRPLTYDADGMTGRNTTFVPNMGWTSSAASGDFILRAVVSYNDLTPWDVGGACQQPDGGVAPDATISTDAGDAAMVPPLPDSGGPDGGVTGDGASDSGESADGAEGADGADAGDAGMGGDDATAGVDATAGGEDATAAGDAAVGGDDAGNVPVGAPKITAISPDEGSNATPVDVVVTGMNFAAGLSLKIGTITTESVVVVASTTINARVPANIAAGVYDVVVTNPDSQAAVLPDGYTVLDKNGGGGTVGDSCACTDARAVDSSADASLSTGLSFLVFACFAWMLSERTRSRRSLPVRTRPKPSR